MGGNGVMYPIVDSSGNGRNQYVGVSRAFPTSAFGPFRKEGLRSRSTGDKRIKCDSPKLTITPNNARLRGQALQS